MTHPESEKPKPEPVGTHSDREQNLARMYALKQQEAAVKAEYEALRDATTPILDGSQYFLDENGEKHYGYAVRPEKLEISESILDEVSDEVRDRIVKPTIDRKALEQEVKAGRISTKTFAKHARITPGTPHIRFD